MVLTTGTKVISKFPPHYHNGNALLVELRAHVPPRPAAPAPCNFTSGVSYTYMTFDFEIGSHLTRWWVRKSMSTFLRSISEINKSITITPNQYVNNMRRHRQGVNFIIEIVSGGCHQPSYYIYHRRYQRNYVNVMQQLRVGIGIKF